MYGLFGKLIAKPGQRDALLKEMLRGSLSEMPGCHLYIIGNDAGDPDALCIYELWATKEDHANSLNLESVQATIAAARPFIAGFGERFEFTPMGGLGLPE